MSIPEFTEDMNIISSLPDKPTLSPEDLKKKFDEGSKKIKDFINNTLRPAVNENALEVINNLTTGGTTKALSAEMGKKLNDEKQNIIGYGTTVPTLAEGQIFIQIFD